LVPSEEMEPLMSFHRISALACAAHAARQHG
jgi:hypothetical protein